MGAWVGLEFGGLCGRSLDDADVQWFRAGRSDNKLDERYVLCEKRFDRGCDMWIIGVVERRN